MRGRIGVAQMKLRPIIPGFILVLIFVVFAAGTAYMIFRNKTKTTDKIFTMVRMGIIYLLALIIGLRPVTVKSEYEFATKNLDVLFVVDTTISMWARDYNGNNERMKGVREDIEGITKTLAGSNFALITFDDNSKVRSPFSQDVEYVRDLMDILTYPDSHQATGSDMSIPYKNVESLLLSSSKKEDRKAIVFFFSDGEITNGKELESYAELAQYVDAGAVLGYGSEAGGKMKVDKGYIYDYTTRQDAVSKIDEDNLKKIAEDLGVEYMNVNSGSASLNGLVQMIKDGSAIVMEESEGAEIYEDKYFYFAAALAVMLLVELLFVIRRERL
jgi:Ca-activated chloride channel family protein